MVVTRGFYRVDDTIQCRAVVVAAPPCVFVDAGAEILGAVLCGVPLWAPAPAAAARLGAAGIVARAAAAGVTRCTMLPSQLADARASCAARGEHCEVRRPSPSASSPSRRIMW